MSRLDRIKVTLGEFVQFTDTQLALKLLAFYASRGLNVTEARKELFSQTKLVAEERQLYENDPEPQRSQALQKLDQKEDRARSEFEAIKVPQEWIDLYFSDTPESYSEEVLEAKIANGEALYVTKLTDAEKEEKKKQKVFSVERLAELIGSEQFKSIDELDQILRAARDATPAAARRLLEGQGAGQTTPASVVGQLLAFMTENTLKQRVANEANAEIIEERRKEEAAIIAKRQDEERKRQEREDAKKRQQEEARKTRALQLKKEEEERLKRLQPTADDSSSEEEDLYADAAEEIVEVDNEAADLAGDDEIEEPPSAPTAVNAPALSELPAATKAKLVLIFSRNNVLSRLISLSTAAAKEVQDSIDAEAKFITKGKGLTSAAESTLDAARKKLSAALTMVANLENDLKKREVEGDAQRTADLVADAIREAARLALVAKAKLSTLKSIEMIERKADLMYHTGSVADAEQWIKFRKMFFDVTPPTPFLWGEYFANILGVKNIDEAKRQIDELHEKVSPTEFDSRPPTTSRLWLLHSSLFVYFHSVARSNHLLDFVFYSNTDSATHGYASLIDSRAPHLLRYLAAACIFHRKRRSPLQKTATLIRNARDRDAITDFIDLVFNKSDYEAGLKKITEAAEVIEDDYFLNSHKTQLLEAMQKFVLEHIIRCHHVVSIPDIARKIGRSAEDAEPWVANLIREAEICAKIDSVKQLVLVDSASLSVAAKVLSAVESVDRIALA